MTAPSVPRESREDWCAELTTFLGPQSFPASHDHLAATLIRRHAPSHLLWRLSVLPRARQFDSLEELLDQLSLSPSGVHDPLAGYEP